MNEELKRAMELYKAPFKYDGKFIVDYYDRPLSFSPEGPTGELIAAALNEYWEKHK